MRNKTYHKQTVVSVSLIVPEGFAGFAVVRFEKGQEKAQFPLRPGEFFGSLDSFLDAARVAGYQVIPPAA
jgi:hypothetical protein